METLPGGPPRRARVAGAMLGAAAAALATALSFRCLRPLADQRARVLGGLLWLARMLTPLALGRIFSLRAVSAH